MEKYWNPFHVCPYPPSRSVSLGCSGRWIGSGSACTNCILEGKNDRDGQECCQTSQEGWFTWFHSVTSKIGETWVLRAVFVYLCFELKDGRFFLFVSPALCRMRTTLQYVLWHNSCISPPKVVIRHSAVSPHLFSTSYLTTTPSFVVIFLSHSDSFS